MQARITNVREALDHLPEAAVLVLEGISWKDYEELLKDSEDRPGVRLTYERRQDSYIEIAASRFFPILTSGVLADFIEQSTTRGQTVALSAFRGWVRNRKSDPEKPV